MYECDRAICIIQYTIDEQQYDILIKCIKSYKKNQPNEKIFLINNSSPYEREIKDDDIIIIKTDNHRELGSIKQAYKLIKAKKYLFVHDNTESLKQLPEYLWETEFMSLWSFPPSHMVDTEIYEKFQSNLEDILRKNLEINLCEVLIHMQKNSQEFNIYGCFGLMFMCDRIVLDKLNNMGIIECGDYINNREDAYASERIITVALYSLGYKIHLNAFQGDILKYPWAWDVNNESYCHPLCIYYIRKSWSGR